MRPDVQNVIIVLFMTHLVQFTCADVFCSTWGNLGCSSYCFLRGRPKGSCQLDQISQFSSCVCETIYGGGDGENELYDQPIDGEGLGETTGGGGGIVNLSQVVSDGNETMNDAQAVQLENELILDDADVLDIEEQNDEEEGRLHWLMRQIIFMPVRRDGLFVEKNLSDPSGYNLDNTRNYRIPSENGSLGAWFIWPNGCNKTFLSQLDSSNKLLIYFHGSSATRGFYPRVQLYRLLGDMGYHVLAFDYRGYGDSSKTSLSEMSVVLDGVSVLQWAAKLINSKNRWYQPLVIVWGHSLGTSIATQAICKWQNQTGMEDMLVSTLVLESAFTQMADVINTFSMGRAVATMIKLLQLDVKSMIPSNVQFNTVSKLNMVEAPTLMLHAEDDPVVSVKLGRKLLNETVQAGKTNIRMKVFEKSLRLRHSHMHRANKLKLYIKEMEDRAILFHNQWIWDNYQLSHS